MTALMTDPKLTIDGVAYTMRLARIDSTRLGMEQDRRCRMAYLYLDYGHSNQAAGITSGLASTTWLDAVVAILAAVGADTWEGLVGRRVYALVPTEEDWGYVRGIANVTDPTQNFLVFEEFAQGRRRVGGGS